MVIAHLILWRTIDLSECGFRFHSCDEDVMPSISKDDLLLQYYSSGGRVVMARLIPVGDQLRRAHHCRNKLGRDK